MSKVPITIEQILDLLKKNSLQITELTADLTSIQLHTPSGQGEWSIQ